MLDAGSQLLQRAMHLKMQLAKLRELKSFHRSLDNPQRTQNRVLRRILAANQDSSFGQKYRLSSVADAGEYRDRVPIHTYEDLRPYIEKQIDGTESGRLQSPTLCLQTSGTTGKPKYIPIYKETLKAYKRCQTINSYTQFAAIKGLFSGKLLTIVSPKVEGYLENGIPYGSMSGVIATSLPKAFSSRIVLPEAVFEIQDYEDRYRLIAALAMSDPKITCLASANPSTFLRLSAVIQENSNELLRYLETGDIGALTLNNRDHARVIPVCRPDQGRAAHLKQLIEEHGQLTFSHLWPNLRGVATWTSGNCALCIPALRQQLSSDIPITDMGYMASEFWGTINMDPINHAGCLTIQDNFYEFIELDSWDNGGRDTCLVSELEEGKRYYIIVTTSDGLYRYFINDVIEVAGTYRNFPTIKFAQKGKGVTSLCGEKLYEGQVIQAVRETCKEQSFETDQFVMLADRQHFSYVLYIESRAELDNAAFGERLVDRLGSQNVEFESKLKSGRIRGVTVRPVKVGTFEALKKAAVLAGQREGQFKTVKLQYLDDANFPFHEHVCP